MGLDICCQVVFEKSHLAMLRAHDHKITQFIARHIQHWLMIWVLNYKRGFFPFDPFCPIYLLKPELFNFKRLFLSVDTKKLEGKLSILKNPILNSAPITYCTGFTNESAKQEFMDILINNLKY